jgi:serine protease inhibitor
VSKHMKTLLVLLIGAALLQCSKNPVSTEDEVVLESNWYAKGLVESDNTFGLKLFKELAGEQEDSNIFISPLSVSMALGMTYNGADGSTKEAMEKTLELSGLTVEEVNESYKNLIRLLTQLDPKVQFQIANSIWYEETLTPEQEFLNVCQEYFDARVSGLDFSDPDAAKTINAWVDENTQGKIQEIVDDPIDASLVSFLINAIYFKGAWTYQFDEELTQDDWFILPDHTKKRCRMMEQRGFYRYFIDGGFEAVDLPYGDGAFSMTVFLPRYWTTVDALIDRFDPDSLSFWMSCLSYDSGDIYIPKFRLEYERELNHALTALGMGIAFAPGADFSKMYENVGVWIDAVKHKTFVEVSEEGTEAAAVTSVQDSYGPGPPGFYMMVDRPFVFMIRENESGTILFIGKIVEPCLP